MSQSPPGEVLNESYRQGWKDLTNLILSGESFSGRERNCAFLNTGGARFATASAASGFDFIDDGRALTTVDWDFDGDLDFWLTNRTAPRLRFLRNDYPTKNHFLVVGLEGVTVNRDAIGARVELLTKAASGGVEKQIRSLRAGEGFLGQSSKWIHFGLGSDSEIDRLVVRWPGASAEEFSGLSRDRFYRIVQGTGRAHRFEPPIQPQRLTRSTVKLPKRTVQSQTLLTSAIPVPDLPYFNFSGEAMKLSDVYGSDQPLLINLFASWCVPCVAELKAFSQSEDPFAPLNSRFWRFLSTGWVEEQALPNRRESFSIAYNFRSFRGERQTISLNHCKSFMTSSSMREGAFPYPRAFSSTVRGNWQRFIGGPSKSIECRLTSQRSRSTTGNGCKRPCPLPDDG